jgi:IS30 family transposase
MVLSRRALTVSDCTLIKARPQVGWSVVHIAAALGCSPSVISGELAHHGKGALGFVANTAQSAADASRRLSGRRSRMAIDGPLFGEVSRLLRLK